MVTLYSTNCPKCKIIEAKLKQLGFEYKVITDIEEMKKLGITTAPVMFVDNKKYDFNNSIRYLKEVADGKTKSSDND